MPQHDHPTLDDVLKINDHNLSDVDGMSDLLIDTAFIRRLHVEMASNGTLHQYSVQDGTPVIGFRQINEGRLHSTGSDRLVTITLENLDASWSCDQALEVANANKGGRDGLVTRQGNRHLKAAFFGAEQQLVYGTGVDSDGFVGLADSYAAADHEFVLDAGGLAGDVGGLTSAWFIRTSADGENLAIVPGNEGLIKAGEAKEQMLYQQDGNGNPTANMYPGITQAISGYLGLQVGSKFGAVRIANIGTAEGSTLTDDMLYEAYCLLPESKRSNGFWVMAGRSRKQLRDGRTATNESGKPAPLPTQMEGEDVDIIGGDSILITESHVPATAP